MGSTGSTAASGTPRSTGLEAADVPVVQVHPRQINATLLEVGQHRPARAVQRASRPPPLLQMPLRRGVLQRRVGQLQPFHADRAGVDRADKPFAVAARDLPIEAVELRQHRVAGPPARPVVRRSRAAAPTRRSAGHRPATAGKRKVDPVAGLEQKLVAAGGAHQGPADEAVWILWGSETLPGR
jgi:hypothetical protein